MLSRIRKPSDGFGLGIAFIHDYEKKNPPAVIAEVSKFRPKVALDSCVLLKSLIHLRVVFNV